MQKFGKGRTPNWKRVVMEIFLGNLQTQKTAEFFEGFQMLSKDLYANRYHEDRNRPNFSTGAGNRDPCGLGRNLLFLVGAGWNFQEM